MSEKWYAFNEQKGYCQKRPQIRKLVLVLRESPTPGIPNAICVGYRKDAAGDKACPYFVVPGHGGRVLAWCDCLPVNFETIWKNAYKEYKNE